MDKKIESPKNQYLHFQWVYIGLSGSVQLLRWMDPTEVRGDCGRAVIHHIALSGSIDALEWAYQNHREWLTLTDKHGTGIAHYIAWSGNPEGLNWIQTKAPEQLDSIARKGRRINYYAARSGNPEMLEWISTFKSADLFFHESAAGETIIHAASHGGLRAEMIEYLIAKCPGYFRLCCTDARDRDGLLPVEVASLPHRSLFKIRDEFLLKCSKKILNMERFRPGLETPEQISIKRIINEFQIEWSELIISGVKKSQLQLDEKKLLQLFTLLPFLKDTVVNNLMQRIQVNNFSFTRNVVTGNELLKLLHIVTNSHSNALFFKKQDSILDKLKKHDSLSKHNLDENMSKCLSFIIKQRLKLRLTPNKTDIPIIDDFIDKLIVTESFKVYLNNSKSSTDVEVKTNDERFKMFEREVDLLPEGQLKKDTKEILVSGIGKFLFSIDDLVDLAMNKRTELYELHMQMPLHLQESAQRDEQYCRSILENKLLTFFDAAEVSIKRGVFNAFCKHMLIGFCFDARLANTLNWLITTDKIKSFAALMEQYIHEEYIPYQMVIEQMPEEELYSIEKACNFIMGIHKDEQCIVDEEYAPDGIITPGYVYIFLQNVCFWDAAQSSKQSLVAQN